MTEYTVKIINSGNGNPDYWYADKLNEEFICTKDSLPVYELNGMKGVLFKTVERKNEKHFTDTMCGWIRIEDCEIISQRDVNEETAQATQLQDLSTMLN